MDLFYRDPSAPSAYVVLNVPLDPTYGTAHREYLDRHRYDTSDGSPPTALFEGVVDGSFATFRDLIRAALDAHVEAAHRRDPALYALYDPALPRAGDRELGAFLRPLAVHGYEMYRNLFERLVGDLRAPSDLPPEERPDWDQTEAHALVREYLASASPKVVFKVPQEDRADPVNRPHLPPPADHWTEPFPWRLLFDRHPDKLPAAPDLFGRRPDELPSAPELAAACWGLKYQLETAFKWTQGQSTLRAFENRPPRIVAATCPSADPADRHRDRGHPFQRPGVDTTHHDQRDDFRAALRHVDADAVSFFGHAEVARANVQTGSSIEFRPPRSGPADWEQLTAADMDGARIPKYQRKPVLVFLNGCGTGPLDGLGPTTVFGQFTNNGPVRGHRVRCVAVVHEAPITFGLELGQEFWKQVLPAAPGAGGEPVGAALLAARQHMVRAYNNPLGVLYALFGDGLLRYHPGAPSHGAIGSGGPPAGPSATAGA
ncbi:hypothetical protein [Gemmata obscuriglobus]|uniref:hypothetical protein n=1 Tax=Gemmata obscuriglobus TaxID=114 RepID=UPI00016C59AF|nr:hypothetical protein [Gemmata obscuriglobus]VTS01644.1 Uncharacterized protein OS=Chondromyces apiculatus DSM 436 GN=CAP_2534 PE=4 SV=1 [Gemmata obscuriglobus UQM 2246]